MSDIIIYQTEDGKSKLDVKLENNTLWLTQGQMVDLFQTTRQNISLHIKNILDDGELNEISVIKEHLTTASDGKDYNTKYYNLDMIIAVGYQEQTITPVEEAYLESIKSLEHKVSKKNKKDKKWIN